MTKPLINNTKDKMIRLKYRYRNKIILFYNCKKMSFAAYLGNCCLSCTQTFKIEKNIIQTACMQNPLTRLFCSDFVQIVIKVTATKQEFKLGIVFLLGLGHLLEFGPITRDEHG